MTVSSGNRRGFTLVEVLVAFAILAMALTAAYGVFSDASRAVSSGERYAVALALAEARLAEIDAMPADGGWDGEGDFAEAYRWRIESRVLTDPAIAAAQEGGMATVLVTVTVTWETGGTVTLETIRLRAS